MSHYIDIDGIIIREQDTISIGELGLEAEYLVKEIDPVEGVIKVQFKTTPDSTVIGNNTLVAIPIHLFSTNAKIVEEHSDNNPNSMFKALKNKSLERKNL